MSMYIHDRLERVREGLGAVTTVWVPWRRGDLFLRVVAIVGGPARAAALAVWASV